jgi:murein DD-endopeptidase MepM/ murein hydrolase activator NlpD
MNRFRPALVAVVALSSLATPVFAAPRLEVRFYPDRELRLHPLNEQRGVASALLQNAAVVNTGDAAATLDSVTLELRAGDELVQSHPLAGAALATQAARSGRLAASGMVEMFAFQFRPQALLAGAKAVGATKLEPGEALLLGHRVFVVQGAGVDRLRLTARGKDAAGTPVEAQAELPIATRLAPNAYAFPLAGTWFVGAGASLHSHHRWVVPEEFALDIARLGEGGRTYRGTGETNADYYAWEAEVRAVADGKVVTVIDKFPDSEDVLKRAGESAEAYAGRVQQNQMALFQQGLEAIGGNVVVIEHAGGEHSHYAHLRQGSLRVKAGDVVKRGQPIAKLGNSGNSTEPHLHFQLSDGAETLLSAGLPALFEGIEILLADAPRALQSGDVVEAK